VLADSAYGDNSEFRRRVRCEGLGYAVGLHRTTTCGAWICWTPIGDPVAVVIWPTPSARWLSAGDLARRNEGKMSSRFATERVVLRRTTSLIPRSGKRSGWLMEMAAWREGSDGLYPDHVAGEHVTGASSFGESSSGGAPNGVRGRQGELGLDHYEGRSFRGWNHHVSMVLVCFAFIVAERSRAFPPSAGKLPRESVRIVTTVRTATRPERHFRIPSSLCAWPSRASWPHGYPMPPVSQTAIDGTAWCTCPVNTDGRLPF